MNSANWTPNARALVAPKRGAWAAFLVLLATLLFAASALAQGTASLTGAVIDAASKKPVGDVVVTATSPAAQGEQIVVTDAAGHYTIPNLPPGDYTIRLDKETYRPYGRGGIALRADSTIRVNVELLPETLKSEEIVVVGSAPTVDVGSTTTGANINKDFTSRVPISRPGAKGGSVRSFESVAATVPGAKGDDFGVSISGTTSMENQYVIDGLSVNNTAFGIGGSPLSMEFIKEVNVVSGGYMPEYGRATGGYLDVVTKTGSNEFHGSIFGNITPGALEGPRTRVKQDGQSIVTDLELRSIRDFGFDIGGPLIKDKLWFYGGIDVGVSTYRLNRALNRIAIDSAGNRLPPDADGYAQVQRIEGTLKSYDAEERTFQYIAKLTYGINADNSLSLSVSGTPTVSGGGGDYGFDPELGGIQTGTNPIAGTYDATANRFISTSSNVILKYSSAFKKKTLLFDASIGWHHEEEGYLLPSDGADAGDQTTRVGGNSSVSWRKSIDPVTGEASPHTLPEFADLGYEKLPNRAACTDPKGAPGNSDLCPVFEYFSGGSDYNRQSYINRYQGKVMLTSLFQGAGHHVAKVGIDLEFMQYKVTTAYTGQQRFAESDDGTLWTDERMYGYLKAPDDPVFKDFNESNNKSTTVGGFVQDSWNIVDKITLNAGVRYDSQFLFDDSGNLGMTLPNQISPRIGVIFDPTQKGRSKLFGSYAQYYESVPLDVADRALSGDREILSRHDATICHPYNQSEQKTTCRDDAGRVPFSNFQQNANRLWRTTGGGTTPIDPDLKPQSSAEILFGGEYEVIPDGRASVTWTHRWMQNIIEDMSRDEAETYFIGNPGSGIASDFPEASRIYDAVTFQFSKAFKAQWLAQANYTISYLRGNVAGLYRPETRQLDPNINSDFDLVSLTANRLGPLPGDSTHEIKLYAAKEFTLPKSMLTTLGLAFVARSGGPTTPLGAHVVYGTDEVFIIGRGLGQRLPWQFQISPHFDYGIKFAKDSVLSVSMDIFNIFNFQAVDAVDETYTNSTILPIDNGTREDLDACTKGQTSCKLKNADGTPFDRATKNPNYGKPVRYQAPRQFRFGARVTF